MVILSEKTQPRLKYMYLSLLRGRKLVTGLSYLLHLLMILIKKYKIVMVSVNIYIYSKIMTTHIFDLNIIFDVKCPLKR